MANRLLSVAREPPGVNKRWVVGAGMSSVPQYSSLDMTDTCRCKTECNCPSDGCQCAPTCGCDSGCHCKPKPDPACGNPHDAIPFLRAYNPSWTDHFYTTDAAEMKHAVADLGFTAEGNAGYVFKTQVGATIPLYRLYQPTALDHFYTTSESEKNTAVAKDGYVFESIIAYVYSSQICGSIPLYRLYNAAVIDHFYTISASERANAAASDGYTEEGIACYVLPDKA
ncbi:predicted protein [Postia placenta Mad-698-R]|nr:predicted protein [Postia placenta Mad-698-R]